MRFVLLGEPMNFSANPRSFSFSQQMANLPDRDARLIEHFCYCGKRFPPGNNIFSRKRSSLVFNDYMKSNQLQNKDSA